MPNVVRWCSRGEWHFFRKYGGFCWPSIPGGLFFLFLFFFREFWFTTPVHLLNYFAPVHFEVIVFDETCLPNMEYVSWSVVFIFFPSLQLQEVDS